MGRSDVLSDQQRSAAAFLNLGIAWQPWPSVTLKTQLDTHSAIYRGSDLQQLSREAVMLSAGGTVRLTPSNSLDLAVVEDQFIHDASPDFSFHAQWRFVF